MRNACKIIKTWRLLHIQAYSIEVAEECVDTKSAKKCKKALQKNKCNKKKYAIGCAKTCGYCEAGNIDVIQSFNLSSLLFYFLE